MVEVDKFNRLHSLINSRNLKWIHLLKKTAYLTYSLLFAIDLDV
jgi:hypothetical protein